MNEKLPTIKVIPNEETTPDVLEISEDRLVDLQPYGKNSENLVSSSCGTVVAIRESKTSPLSGKALYLDRYYEWVLGKDDRGVQVLVPLKKVR